ncbi:MAG: fasciclin domain-containing protein [Bacteroidota bacterium]
MIYRFSVLAFAFLFLVGCSDPISVDSEAPVAEQGRFTPPNPATKNLTIAEIVVAQVDANGEFETLLAALAATDLVGAVSGRTIFTVFAPTDAAFAELGLNPHNVGDLDKDALSNILLYHVVPGRKVASIVLGSESLTAAQGGTLKVDADNVALIDANGGSAGIVGVDIAARNGIIHVIDSVVLP